MGEHGVVWVMFPWPDEDVSLSLMERVAAGRHVHILFHRIQRLWGIKMLSVWRLCLSGEKSTPSWVSTGHHIPVGHSELKKRDTEAASVASRSELSQWSSMTSVHTSTAIPAIVSRGS